MYKQTQVKTGFPSTAANSLNTADNILRMYITSHFDYLFELGIAIGTRAWTVYNTDIIKYVIEYIYVHILVYIFTFACVYNKYYYY